ncbi:hypothetical protein ACWD6P_10600 [Streptomyces sp. NPDC002446]
MPDLHTPALDHAEPVNQAIDRLAPRWTTWTLQTIQQHGEMRLPEIASALPWLGTQNTHNVLWRMHTSGLVDRAQRGVYTVSPLGRSAQPAHRTLASWHRAHFADDGPALPEAERTEDALRRLRGRGAVDILHALAHHGPLPPSELRETAGLATISVYYRLQQLQEDQLLTPVGSYSRASYTLTPAAQALGPVYAELAAFTRQHPAVERSPVTQQTASAARANAAVRRSLPGMFSHAPAPQPSVPTYVTALSHPSRTR